MTFGRADVNFDILVNALLSVTDKVYHYRAYGATDKYIVWAEDGQAGSVWAENKMQNQVVEGTVDYFTKSEDDTNVEAIQNALNDAEISWRLNSVQYELNTNLIHFEWVWQVVM